MLTEFAPAKINLSLHVLGRRADGYHELESLVGFADIGDRLSLQPGAGLGLSLTGAFAGPLAAEADNLVLRAARLFAQAVPGAELGHFTLEKALPIASGLGGGSSDAAAALRLLGRQNGLAHEDPRLMAAARALGADVPVCLDPQPRMMRGIGHALGPALKAAAIPALLVNPRIGVETRQVFAALRLQPGEMKPPGADKTAASLADSRNDLQAPAMGLAPVIADIIGALAALPGCLLARMSGSGATCFALFSDASAAKAGAARLTETNPAWWIAPCAISAPAIGMDKREAQS